MIKKPGQIRNTKVNLDITKQKISNKNQRKYLFSP